MTARLVLLAALLIGACALHPRPAPPPWQKYADKGAFQVRGSPRSDPGPTILRALEREPSVARVLTASGEPDTVQIVTVHGTSRRIVLTYRGGPTGRPRRVVLEPSDGEPRSDRPASRTHASTRPARRAASPRGEPGQAVASDRTPTASQRLECPIDPERPDCRALCAGGESLEWCR